MNPIVWWCEIHGEVAPIGFVLRSIYKDIWLRFHSLPDSKRYPESEEEMQEVVHRAKTVANALFEPDEPIIVLTSNWYFEDTEYPESVQIIGEPTQSGSAVFRVNKASVAPEFDDYFITWAREDAWPPAYFEKLVREVAVGNEALICFISPRSGNICYPYDGGMDIFVPSEAQRQSFSLQSDWRSKLISGL